MEKGFRLAPAGFATGLTWGAPGKS